MNGQTPSIMRFPLPGGSRAEITGTNGGNYILHSDWLGTARLTTALNNRTMSYDAGYAPYGENYANAGSLQSPLNFTGQSQDTNTGLFDFLYREYNPVQGRWISPDPAGLAAVNPANPQTWNRYAYALNNPLSSVDPTGLFCVWDDGSFDSPDDPGTGSASSCGGAGGNWFDGSPLDYGLNADWSNQANANFANQWLSQQADYTIQTDSWAQVDQNIFFPDGVANVDIGPLGPLDCAATFAPSLARRAGIGGDTFMGKVGQAFLGNTFSGMVDFYNAATSAKGTAPALESLAVNGLRQGLPGGGPLSQGLSGAAQDATLKFAFQNIGAQRLGQATVNTAASVVGDAKIGYDLLNFMYAGYQCVK
jgi:RHS repeat-associated protein